MSLYKQYHSSVKQTNFVRHYFQKKKKKKKRRRKSQLINISIQWNRPPSIYINLCNCLTQWALLINSLTHSSCWVTGDSLEECWPTKYTSITITQQECMWSHDCLPNNTFGFLLLRNKSWVLIHQIIQIWPMILEIKQTNARHLVKGWV